MRFRLNEKRYSGLTAEQSEWFNIGHRLEKMLKLSKIFNFPLIISPAPGGEGWMITFDSKEYCQTSSKNLLSDELDWVYDILIEKLVHQYVSPKTDVKKQKGKK